MDTRARLVAVAREIIAERGYEAMRVEEVVLRTGVAKGTFFAHFRDKEALLEQLIGEQIDAQLDRIASHSPPQNVAELVEALMPLISVMSSERYVFDLILRYSGAAAVTEIGPIAQTFGRSAEVVGRWVALGPFRKDVSPEILSEGIQAFLVHVMALHFCALHRGQTVREMLTALLSAWIMPKCT
ncbi:MAG: TetR/AcrR family transcriptional regulator [Rhizobiaceae bacterium]